MDKSYTDSELLKHFKSGGTISNNINYQYFVHPKGDVERGERFKYDLNSGKYTKYDDIKKFFRAIRKSLKTGF